MKKIIFILICYWLLCSCNLMSDNFHGEEAQYGFLFDVKNDTDIAYNSPVIYIGGIKDDVFISIDSIPTRAIPVGSDDWNIHVGDVVSGGSGSRWKPDLQKIKDIPSKQYNFKMKLSNSREDILRWTGNEDLIFGIDPSTIIAHRKGEINIRISKDIITVDYDDSEF